MHLLRVKTGDIEIIDVDDESANIDYAILSHAWLSPPSDEVTFRDLTQGDYKLKPGYRKLQFCLQQAEKDGYEYVWIDTCCIDKTSSELLRQAITNMFAWYRDAGKCYALLTDVSVESISDAEERQGSWERQFRRSRWFTRGWTLQELIAPRSVEFFSAEGIRLGDKQSLQQCIHEITQIPHQALQSVELTQFSVEDRFSWAEKRQTKLLEDKAYCLLGIFNVFMLPNYGEGSNAFKRLRERINHDRDKSEAEADEMRKILGRLPLVPEAAFNSQLNSSHPVCLQNTRTELLQDLDDWVVGTNGKSLLWLNGIAGTGKSTVARTMSRVWHDRNILGASFFFSSGNGEVSSSRKLMSTLAWQLASRIPSTRSAICDAFREQEDIVNNSLWDQWEHLILKPLSKFKPKDGETTLVFVIDALDECDEKNNLRGILMSFANTKRLKNVRLKILITTRPELRIRSILRKVSEADLSTIVLHEVPSAYVERDLQLYFEEKFSNIKEERGYDSDWPGSRIIRHLVKTSCGLFIWASTAYRFVRGMHAKKRLRVILDRRQHRRGRREYPEKALDEIYTTVLRASFPHSDIESEKLSDFDVLRDILGSIVVLRSPLSLKSLAMLLNLPPDDVKDMLADLHPIFQISSGIASEPVRLHHPAFRDYLLDKHRCQNPNFHVDERQIHKVLAKSCIQIMKDYLRRDICRVGSPGTVVEAIDVDRIAENIPTALQYACLYWVDHCRNSAMELHDDDEVHQFVQEHFLHWLEVMSILGKGAEMGAIIRSYHSLLVPRENKRQIPFISDARLLMVGFDDIVEKAPLQVYCATLAFCRPRNQLKHHFRPLMSPYMGHVNVVEADVPEPRMEFNYVCDLAFTPDGSRIAAGSNLPLVRLWDTASRKAVRKFEEPFQDKVSSVAISPDGTLLAAGADDWTVAVWNLRTDKRLFTLTTHKGWVNSVTFSPDGKTLATGAMDDLVILTNASNGRQRKSIDNTGGVNSLAFSPDSSKIAAASVDRTIKVWSSSTQPEEIPKTFDGHGGSVNSVKFCRSGKSLVSGSDDKTIRIWDAITEDSRILKGHEKKVWAVVFSPDASLIVSGSEDRTVRVWDTSSGVALRTIADHTSGLNSVSFSPDGRYFASSSFDDEVQLYDGRTWDLQGQLEDIEAVSAVDMMESMHFKVSGLTKTHSKGHTRAVTCIAYSPNHEIIASGSEDTNIRLWLLQDFNVTEYRTLEGHSEPITQLRFSSSSQQLVSSSLDRTIKVWDVEAGNLIRTLEGHTDRITHTTFSPDGLLLASCSFDGSVRLWDSRTWTLVHILHGHSDEVNDISFSHDGKLLASASKDKTVRIWHVSLQDLVAVLDGHDRCVTSVAFSPDNSSIVSTSEDKTVRLWTGWDDSEIIQTTIRGDGRTVESATFSPDGQLVAFCTAGNILSAWDVKSKKFIDSGVIEATIRKVTFSTDGEFLETDRGVVDSEIFLARPETRCSHYTHFVTDDWLLRDSESILWLPEAYRASCVAVVQSTTIMGHSSGAISFVQV